MNTKNKEPISIITFIVLIVSILTIKTTTAYGEINSNKSKFNRIYGKDRYETSAKISQSSWEKAENVVIVNGKDFPDALCASPLAKHLDAPIILCKGEVLDENIKKEIIRLTPSNAYIVGGEGAVSPKIIDDLTSMNIKCNRLGGKNRYETSVEVAKFLGVENGIMIAYGENFPDSLSIAPIAAQKSFPILLSETTNLPQIVKDFIKDKEIKNSYLIGGKGILGENIEKEIPGIKRLGGSNRYQTNVEILKEFSNELSFEKVYLTLGSTFPDALCATAIAAKNNSPIILMEVYYSFETKDFVKEKGIKNENMIILGGPSIMPETILEKKNKPQPPKPKPQPPKPSLDSKIKPSIVYATMKNNAGGFKRGSKVEIVNDISNGSSYKVYSNGKYGTVGGRSLSIPGDPATDKTRLAKNELESYVNSKGFYSNTKYFIWVDLNRQLVNVFTGSRGRWKHISSFDCATGKNVTPTVRGHFQLQDRGKSFFNGIGVGALYWIRFYGNYLFHSILVNTRGQVVDATLGKRASHGCIRVGMNNIKWLYSLPSGTRVWIN